MAMRGRWISILLACAALAACAGPSGRRLTASEYQAEEQRAARARAAESGAEAAPAARPGVAPRSTPTEPGPLTSLGEVPIPARDELEFQLADLVTRRESLRLEHAAAAEEADLERKRAGRGLRRATEDLEHFQRVEVERLLQEDRLELALARDTLAAVSQELQQLERLYGDPAARIPGAEAALDQGRRAQERAQERLVLRDSLSAELRERQLPRRIEELSLAVETAAVAERAAEWRARAGQLLRQAEENLLEREEARLRERLTALGRRPTTAVGERR